MNNNVSFDYEHHEFSLRDEANKSTFYEEVSLPLSVIVQVTRRCPLNCDFCSESEDYPDPSFESLEELKSKLIGVKRIYLSGGEPLMRDDIFRLLHLYRKEFEIIGLPTNCIYVTSDVCNKLKGVVNYINAGLDGPRTINNAIRGGYDQIINGLGNLRNSGIEVSLSTVILRSTLPYLQYVVQIADNLGVTKVKMVIPVFRGRAKKLRAEDFASKEAILAKFDEIKELKRTLGWKPRVKFTFWGKDTEGYAWLVYPNRKVYAWPVLDAPDSVELIGDLNENSIHDIWQKYPYKINHINKYVGISMFKA
jgi:MoaA/NifB/PqqE/SkfB family radical SAM enzyme